MINWVLGLGAVQSLGFLLGVIVVAIIRPETTAGMYLWFIVSLLFVNATAPIVRLAFRKRRE